MSALDLQRLRAEGQAFMEKISLETYLAYAGLKATADLQPIYDEYEDVLGEEALDLTLDAFRSMLRYGIQGFRLRQLRTVRVPALVLWGAQDTVDSVPAGRKSARALRAPFHMLAGAGHLSMLAAPKAIAREIDSFARH